MKAKDHQIIAKALGTVFRKMEYGPADPQVDMAINEFCILLADENPRFNEYVFGDTTRDAIRINWPSRDA